MKQRLSLSALSTIKSILCLGLLFTLIVTVAASTRTWFPLKREVQLSNHSELLTLSPEQSESEAVELVTLRPDGFMPAEMTLPAKGFYLALSNRSREESITLRLEREQGARVIEMTVPKGMPHWGQRLNLPQGNYLLTVAEHPQWKCRIRVEKR